MVLGVSVLASGNGGPHVELDGGLLMGSWRLGSGKIFHFEAVAVVLEVVRWSKQVKPHQTASILGTALGRPTEVLVLKALDVH